MCGSRCVAYTEGITCSLGVRKRYTRDKDYFNSIGVVEFTHNSPSIALSKWMCCMWEYAYTGEISCSLGVRKWYTRDRDYLTRLVLFNSLEIVRISL